MKGKEERYWVFELQERAGSCAEQGERVDHVGPRQWVAVGHLEVH